MVKCPSTYEYSILRIKQFAAARLLSAGISVFHFHPRMEECARIPDGTRQALLIRFLFYFHILLTDAESFLVLSAALQFQYFLPGLDAFCTLLLHTHSQDLQRHRSLNGSDTS